MDGKHGNPALNPDDLSPEDRHFVDAILPARHAEISAVRRETSEALERADGYRKSFAAVAALSIVFGIASRRADHAALLVILAAMFGLVGCVGFFRMRRRIHALNRMLRLGMTEMLFQPLARHLDLEWRAGTEGGIDEAIRLGLPDWAMVTVEDHLEGVRHGIRFDLADIVVRRGGETEDVVFQGVAIRAAVASPAPQPFVVVPSRPRSGGIAEALTPESFPAESTDGGRFAIRSAAEGVAAPASARCIETVFSERQAASSAEDVAAVVDADHVTFYFEHREIYAALGDLDREADMKRFAVRLLSEIELADDALSRLSAAEAEE